MTQELSTERQQPLPKLEGFCRALCEALHPTGLELPKVFDASITAECVRCGIRISGVELFALSQPPSEELSSAKIGRLRLGDCARQGCNGYEYRLTFRSLPTLDWPKLISQADAIQQEQSPEYAVATKATKRLHWRGTARRVGVALGVVLLLLVLRQLYLGGRIPLLREPEHFRVTIDPNHGSSR
jgi:hypothetical protein